MKEQYKDSYQNKYREETAQIHAPQSLIEKTKAAVREEERRLAISKAEDVNRHKQVRVFSVRKWAYPLTAAAAIVILASVSLTMRGLKSRNMSVAPDAVCEEAAESGAAYEEAAAGADYAESSDAGGFYEEAAAGMPAAESVEAPMMEEEASDEAFAEDMTADVTAGAAETDSSSAVQNADVSQTNDLSRDFADAAAPVEEKAAAAVPEGAIEEAAGKKQEAAEREQQGEAGQEDYTARKVTKRPARFIGSDVQLCRYEGKTFRVLEGNSGGNDPEKAWEAYVEISAGEGYVICGEARSVDDFLAAAYQKLEEEAE